MRTAWSDPIQYKQFQPGDPVWVYLGSSTRNRRKLPAIYVGRTKRGHKYRAQDPTFKDWPDRVIGDEWIERR